MDSPYTPPLAEVGTQKPRSLGKWIFLGCSGSLVIFIFLITSCIFAVNAGKKRMDPICMQYLKLIQDKKFDEAYSLWGEEGNLTLPLDKHRTFVSGILEKTGSIREFEYQSVFSGVDQKGHWGRLVYKTTFDKCNGIITITLREYSGAYKIDRLNVKYAEPTNSMNQPTATNP
jgi:hypothetical protein